MNKKALTVLTIAAMLITTLFIASSLFLPSSDAPEVNLILHDADGVKTVSMGETAEYAIKVENTGTTTKHIDLSRDGSASGWESSLSHEEVNLQPGDEQVISLYVTPTEEDAASHIDVNVIATRGDNVTIVSTTTYLSGEVFIRKDGESEWRVLNDTTPIEEGDDIKTELNSSGQFIFQDVTLILKPNTEMHIRFIYTTGEIGNYEFHLNRGKAAFKVDITTNGSRFTLEMAGNARIVSTSEFKSVFLAEADGHVRVFEGTVPYYPTPTRDESEINMTNITAGEDSSGETFPYIKLSYDNDVVSVVIKTIKDDTLGFDNQGDFIASGDLDGFVFRIGDTDTFFVYGLDIESIEVDISTVQAGTFDLVYSRYAPERKGFSFVGMSTPSGGTVEFSFKEDEVYLKSSSKLTYDFEVRYKETERFYLNDMTLDAGQGNTYKVLNYVHLQNDEVNTVLFGRDEDGDGEIDDEVMMRTGMTGEEVYDDLEDEDDASNYIVVAVALAIIIIIAVMYFILQPAGPDMGGPEPAFEPESFKEADEGEKEQGPEEKEMDEDLDTMPPPPEDFPSPEADDLFRDQLEEMELPREETMDTGGPEPAISMVEDLVDRKKELLLEEEYDRLVDLPPELRPTESENPYALPQESIPPSLLLSPATISRPQEDLTGETADDLPIETEPESYAEETEPEFPEDDEDRDIDLDSLPYDEPIIFPPRRIPTSIPQAQDPGEMEGEESEDDVARISREDLQERLRKVRDLKYEMDALESVAGDDSWWDDWDGKMKKDIEVLSQTEEVVEED